MICETKTNTQPPSDHSVEKSVDCPDPQLKLKLDEEILLPPVLKKSYDAEYYHRRYLLHREEILAKHKEYKRLNREKINESRRRWRANNPEKELEMNKRFREKHRAKLIENGRARYHANPEKHKKVRRESYWRHHERERAYNIDYSRRNRSRITAQRREREERDLCYAIGEHLRRSLVKTVIRRKTKKSDSTLKLLGCSLPYFIHHIQQQFDPFMNWDNWGSYWHIDHLVPIAAFDLVDPEEQQWCFSFVNLRPLERSANHRKSDTLPNPLPSWLPVHLADRIHKRSVDRLALKA